MLLMMLSLISDEVMVAVASLAGGRSKGACMSSVVKGGEEVEEE